MAKIRYDDDEKLLALAMLAEELGFERRNHFRAHDLFICSIGRIFLRYFSAQDAVDSEVMIHPLHHHAAAIDGWSWTPRTNPEAYLRDKWTQRISLYLSIHGGDLAHIRDWLLVSAAEAHDWLRNVDDRGRPKKLMKCGSIPMLAHEADKWLHREPAVVTAQRALGADDISWDADLGDGYHLVRLLSPEALDAETLALRHCIGRGSYDDKLAREGHIYLSVRDQDGTPVATLEVIDAVLFQCQGFRNTLPGADVLAAVDRLMIERGWETVDDKRSREAREAGIVVEEIARRRP